MSAPLRGLVLSGGHSTRMRQDKAALAIAGVSQLQRAAGLLTGQGLAVSVSVRADQTSDPLRARYPQIIDAGDVQGPAAGLLAAPPMRMRTT